MTAYDRDLHAWAAEQAALLRARSSNAIDWENIAEEIEAVGQSQHDQLERRLMQLLTHLLKWKAQPELHVRCGRSWKLSIIEQRRRIARLLKKNPSLNTDDVFADVLPAAYELALIKAQKQTGLDEGAFPAECPWSIGEVRAEGWLPN